MPRRNFFNAPLHKAFFNAPLHKAKPGNVPVVMCPTAYDQLAYQVPAHAHGLRATSGQGRAYSAARDDTTSAVRVRQYLASRVHNFKAVSARPDVAFKDRRCI
jgi:hypothetical protein